MQIQRRDETPADSLGPRIMYLWSKKKWILLPAIVVFFASYLVMRFLPEEFVATANIYVSRMNLIGDDLGASPLGSPSLALLVTNDQLLGEVRERYVKQFNVHPPVFEKFKKQFTVKTEVLQDTTVRKDVAPILMLKVQSQGREQTRFLIDTWSRMFVEKYGNYTKDEAKAKLEGLQAEDKRVESELREAEAKQACLTAEIRLQQKLLAEKMDLLAPAELRRPQDASNPTLNNATNLQVLVEDTVPKAPGYIRRLSNVQYELAHVKEAPAGSQLTSSPEELKAEEKALQQVIAQTETSIAELQTTVSAMQQQLSALTRDIQLKADMQKQLYGFISRVDAVACLYRQGNGPNGLPMGADLQMLSQPVMPELRAWPKRTLVAGALAVATLILSFAALVAGLYLRELNEKTGPPAPSTRKDKPLAGALR